MSVREMEAGYALYKDATRNAQRWQSMYDDLLNKYHDLAVPKAIPTTPVEMPDREPSIVTLAIREQADGDQALASYLRTYANKCKRDGMNEQQIVDALSKWETTEPDPLSAP